MILFRTVVNFTLQNNFLQGCITKQVINEEYNNNPMTGYIQMINAIVFSHIGFILMEGHWVGDPKIPHAWATIGPIHKTHTSTRSFLRIEWSVISLRWRYLLWCWSIKGVSGFDYRFWMGVGIVRTYALYSFSFMMYWLSFVRMKSFQNQKMGFLEEFRAHSSTSSQQMRGGMAVSIGLFVVPKGIF